MKVLHVVRTFGNENQGYTTKLLNNFNSIGELNHSVITDYKLKDSSSISVLSTKVKKKNYLKILFIIKCFNNSILRRTCYCS